MGISDFLSETPTYTIERVEVDPKVLDIIEAKSVEAATLMVNAFSSKAIEMGFLTPEQVHKIEEALLKEAREGKRR